MGYGFAYDGAPSRCSGGARPGIIALRDGVRQIFKCSDMGTYVCRSNTGAAGLSIHADGRAWDAGARGDLNKRIFNWLVANAEQLGVQAVIGTPRRAWNSRERRVKYYSGPHPHDDHVHVELCRAAAQSLTKATVLAAGKSGTTQEEKDVDDTQNYKLTSTWEAVGRLEKEMAATKNALAAIQKALADLAAKHN